MKVYLILYLIINLVACNRKVPANSALAVGSDSARGDTIAAVAPPASINEKISSIRQEPVWNPPAEIHEYELDGRSVFVISADCCDRFTTAVDSNCKTICAPSGGFTGRGDGKCPDFFKKAKYIRLVWKDDRERNR